MLLLLLLQTEDLISKALLVKLLCQPRFSSSGDEKSLQSLLLFLFPSSYAHPEQEALCFTLFPSPRGNRQLLPPVSPLLRLFGRSLGSAPFWFNNWPFSLVLGLALDSEAQLSQQLMPPSESYGFPKALQLRLVEVQ